MKSSFKVKPRFAFIWFNTWFGQNKWSVIEADTLAEGYQKLKQVDLKPQKVRFVVRNLTNLRED